MRQKQTKLQGVVIHKAQSRVVERLLSGRGTVDHLIGPDDGASCDVHVIELLRDSAPGRMHIHPDSGNIYFILSGSISLETPTAAVVLVDGDSCHIAPGTPHRVAVAGSSGARILEIYTRAPVATQLVD